MQSTRQLAKESFECLNGLKVDLCMMGTPETENQTYMPEFEFHSTQDCPKPSPYNWTPIGCYNIMMQYEDFEDDENNLES